MTDVRMNFEQVEAMARTLENTVERISGLRQAMLNIAQLIDDGGFVNPQGTLWVAALRGSVQQDLGKTQDFFAELAGDVSGALHAVRDGDNSGASRFSA